MKRAALKRKDAARPAEGSPRAPVAPHRASLDVLLRLLADDAEAQRDSPFVGGLLLNHVRLTDTQTVLGVLIEAYQRDREFERRLVEQQLHQEESAAAAAAAGAGAEGETPEDPWCGPGLLESVRRRAGILGALSVWCEQYAAQDWSEAAARLPADPKLCQGGGLRPEQLEWLQQVDCPAPLTTAILRTQVHQRVGRMWQPRFLVLGSGGLSFFASRDHWMQFEMARLAELHVQAVLEGRSTASEGLAILAHLHQLAQARRDSQGGGGHSQQSPVQSRSEYSLSLEDPVSAVGAPQANARDCRPLQEVAWSEVRWYEVTGAGRSSIAIHLQASGDSLELRAASPAECAMWHRHLELVQASNHAAGGGMANGGATGGVGGTAGGGRSRGMSMSVTAGAGGVAPLHRGSSSVSLVGRSRTGTVLAEPAGGDSPPGGSTAAAPGALPTVLWKGLLSKKSSKLRHIWNKRFWVLLDDGRLMYFKKASDFQPPSALSSAQNCAANCTKLIPVRGIQSAHISRSGLGSDAGRRVNLTMRHDSTSERGSFELRAESSEDAQRFCNLLQRQIPLHQHSAEPVDPAMASEEESAAGAAGAAESPADAQSVASSPPLGSASGDDWGGSAGSLGGEASAFPEAAGSPEEAWQEMYTEEGDRYWWNSVTDESSWEDPRLWAAGGGGSLDLDMCWEERRTDDGTPYWYNFQSDESQWVLDPAIVERLRQHQLQPQDHPEETSGLGAPVAPEDQAPAAAPVLACPQAASAIDEAEPQAPTKESPSPVAAVATAGAPAKKALPPPAKSSQPVSAEDKRLQQQLAARAQMLEAVLELHSEQRRFHLLMLKHLEQQRTATGSAPAPASNYVFATPPNASAAALAAAAASTAKAPELTKLDPAAVAAELTSEDWRMLRRLPARELIRKEWTRHETAPQRCPNLLKLVQEFNDRSYWVAGELLSHTDSLQDRVASLSFWTAVGVACLKLHNWFAAFAILNGLHMSPLARLKRTFEAVPSKVAKRLAELVRELDTAKNWSAYRARFRDLQGAGVAQIPHLQVCLKDLFSLEELENFVTPGDDAGGDKKSAEGPVLVNFHKFSKIQRVVQDIQYAQNVPFSLPARDPKVVKTLRSSRDFVVRSLFAGKNPQQLSDDDRQEVFWQLSYRCEPKSKSQAFELTWTDGSRAERLQMHQQGFADLWAALRPILEARKARALQEQKLRQAEDARLADLRERWRLTSEWGRRDEEQQALITGGRPQAVFPTREKFLRHLLNEPEAVFQELLWYESHLAVYQPPPTAVPAAAPEEASSPRNAPPSSSSSSASPAPPASSASSSESSSPSPAAAASSSSSGGAPLAVSAEDQQ